MSGLFLCGFLGWAWRGGVSDAVGGFGCGVRICEWRPNLGAAVEDFFNFWRFCSTLEPARAGFGVGGRTFFQILEILFYLGAARAGFWCGSRQNSLEQSVFCLLCGPQALDLVVGVDKIR